MGGTQTIRIDTCFVAATNRDLKAEVEKGTFREDLWYRLNVLPIPVPPLRDRKEDIPALLHWFIQQSNKKLGKKIEKISNSASKILQNYSWPGNVRELENVISRAAITTPTTTLQADAFRELQKLPNSVIDAGTTLADMERHLIMQTLKKTDWKIQGPNGAAEKLGLKPTTLRGRMKKRGIQRPAII